MMLLAISMKIIAKSTNLIGGRIANAFVLGPKMIENTRNPPGR